MDEFKERQRAMWAAGDYATVSQYVEDVGEHVVARTEIAPGMKVLDVGCGPGNAALPAAREGATVTGLDLTPELLEAGRAKAARAGLEVEWVEGDAEALPFGDDTFHRVLSTFGHMFAPRHRQAAAEMARVCGEGGTIGVCCWTPEGTVGDVSAATASYMPPPPDYALSPILWGTEEHVREMFGGEAKGFEFERKDAVFEWGSLEGFADFFLDHFGPPVTARQVLGDRFQELRSDLVEIWDERNDADDGTLRMRQEYLVSLIRL